MKLNQLCWLAILLSGHLSASSLSLTIPSEQITLNYDAPARLEQVMTDVVHHTKSRSPILYPIAIQLFDLERESDAQTLKQRVMKELGQIANADTSLKSSVGILIEQIKRWDVGYRENLTLDIDRIRLQPKANPMIVGRYELLLPKRSKVVTFGGLLFSPQQVSLQAEQKLSDYLKQVNMLSSAHPSYAWVVYPDGHYKRVGYSYWNDESTSLTPGSYVFLGFNSESEHLLRIEEQIVKLVTMRKSL